MKAYLQISDFVEDGELGHLKYEFCDYTLCIEPYFGGFNIVLYDLDLDIVPPMLFVEGEASADTYGKVLDAVNMIYHHYSN